MKIPCLGKLSLKEGQGTLEGGCRDIFIQIA